MNERLGKQEKLKSKILIQKLFEEGKSLKKYPLRLIYLPISKENHNGSKVGFSVPKRNHKKAVDRIKLKRLMREAFRKNKYLVINNLYRSYAFMFIFTGKELMSYSKIFSVTQDLLKKMSDAEKEWNNKKKNT